MADEDDLLSLLPPLQVPNASPAVANSRVIVVGGSVGGLAAAGEISMPDSADTARAHYLFVGGATNLSPAELNFG